MSATPAGPQVTGDELIKHRLDQFEEWRQTAAVTIQTTERAVDLQKLETATVKGLLVEVRTELRGEAEHTRSSLARLHERLDEITTAEAREEGREAGERSAWIRTWKVVGFTVMATIGFAGVVVALLTLVLH